MSDNDLTGLTCCANCLFSRTARIGASVVEQRLCFRYPPVPVVIDDPQGQTIQSMNPVVDDQNWCGEFIDKPIEGRKPS